MTIDGVIRREEADGDGFKYGGWFFPVAVRGDGGRGGRAAGQADGSAAHGGRPSPDGKRGRRIGGSTTETQRAQSFFWNICW